MAPHVAVTALALIGLFNVDRHLRHRKARRRECPSTTSCRSSISRARSRSRCSCSCRCRRCRSTCSRSRWDCCGCRRCRRPTASSRRCSACATSRCCRDSHSSAHQVGSFLGAWLGGVLYDTTGSYDIVWCLSIALSVAAGFDQPADRRARDPAFADGGIGKRKCGEPSAINGDIGTARRGCCRRRWRRRAGGRRRCAVTRIRTDLPGLLRHDDIHRIGDDGVHAPVEQFDDARRLVDGPGRDAQSRGMELVDARTREELVIDDRRRCTRDARRARASRRASDRPAAPAATPGPPRAPRLAPPPRMTTATAWRRRPPTVPARRPRLLRRFRAPGPATA